MMYSSAEAAKVLRKLNEDQAALKEKEEKSAVFVAALEEEPDSVRPAYDYDEMQKKLEELERKVRIVKHAINVFNVTTEVPGFGMTVDQMLVYIPQLSEQKRRLARMAARLPKERCSSSGYGGKTIVEYQYANYDIEQAEKDLTAVSDLLARAQTALDLVNSKPAIELKL